MSGKNVEVEFDQDFLTGLLLKSRRVKERAEDPEVKIGNNSIEISAKVKLPGLNKKISVLVELKEVDKNKGNTKFEIKQIKPSLFGLSKKIIGLIPENRYVDVEKGKYLNVHLGAVLQKLGEIESDSLQIHDLTISDGKIKISGTA